MRRDRKTDIDIDPALEEVLERVCEQEGLNSHEAAMEYLVSRGIRGGGQKMIGRGRALYAVNGGRSD
ncbi:MULTISPECIES: hypothetical protein [unclassified Halomonas]|uniref:hypothetical protein n=1 Tax=unclassified Halomonas TaxID=2609666 RepID=UPI0007D9C08C|nr:MULTISPECIES: hypothetical protein [unclassified Halomonas]MBT2784786.1 hypothetical protein [Halomonas sp. ISL-106]MBT2796480.1 hypothetical protein [Halomonas sp. ISL-104]OAL59728.1 hypothetical protein A6R74_00160 [Halomonas sp. ALS9]